MNPFLQSIFAVLLNVLFGGMTWKGAIEKWLIEQIAVKGSREAVEGELRGLEAQYAVPFAVVGNSTTETEWDDFDEKCGNAIPGKFFDGKFRELFKNIDWQKIIAIFFQYLPLILTPPTPPVPNGGQVE